MILGLTVALILVGSYAQVGKCLHEENNRTMWVVIFACILMGWALPNPWLGALLALTGVNIIQLGNPRNHVEPHLYPALVWGSLYLILTQQLTVAAVPALLGAMLAVGCIASLWTIYGLFVPERPYKHEYRLLWGKPFTIWESKDYWMVASLGNPNHYHAVCACAMASGIGLLLLGYAWVWPAFVLACLPMLAALWHGDGSGAPSMMHGYAFTLLLCVGPLWFGIEGWVASILTGSLAFAYVWSKPVWWCLRQEIWAWAWRIYRGAPWYRRLIGIGTGAWLPLVDHHRPFPSPPTNPHSEFVALLIDHGLLGVAVFSGYLLTAFWKASHAGVEGQAVFLVGAVLTVCAVVSFPFHNYLEVGCYDEKTGQVRMNGHGATALNLFSLTTAVMLEVLP